MTAGTIADRLIAAGMNQCERSSKRALYAEVLDHHAASRGGPPQFAVWVPGRLEVLGKHTDYAGGRTLVCAVPRGFAVVASARDDDRVRVVDTRRGESLTIDIADAGAAPTGWRRYADVTVRRLARNFPGAPLGADLVVASDLPSASGMSSSSALIIAIAVALGRLARLDTHPAWMANIDGGLDSAGYYACIENGKTFGTLEGDGGVGTHGGSEDHTAIIEGRPGEVSAFAFVPPRAIATARVPDAWRFVIAPSDVAARKTGEAKIPYNRLSAGISILLDAWNRQYAPARSLAAAIGSDRDALDRLQELCESAATSDAPAAWLRERLDHFVREDARIDAALAAFAAADTAAVGTLADGSQREADTLLRNQVPATIALAADARRLGAFAASSFGAGFGGAAWALAPATEAEGFARRWRDRAFVMTPGPPVTVMTS